MRTLLASLLIPGFMGATGVADLPTVAPSGALVAVPGDALFADADFAGAEAAYA